MAIARSQIMPKNNSRLRHQFKRQFASTELGLPYLSPRKAQSDEAEPLRLTTMHAALPEDICPRFC
jgi:hypothetical protein